MEEKFIAYIWWIGWFVLIAFSIGYMRKGDRNLYHFTGDCYFIYL